MMSTEYPLAPFKFWIWEKDEECDQDRQDQHMFSIKVPGSKHLKRLDHTNIQGDVFLIPAGSVQLHC